MVTIDDLSRRLGISKTQISRALNGYPDVAAKTRQRIVEAALEIGYRPNALARNLRMGRSGIVGLVLNEGAAQLEANIMAEMLVGLAVEFHRRNTLVVLTVIPRDGTIVEAYERLSADGRLEGFVVLNPGVDQLGIRYLQELKLPFVVHGRHTANVEYAYVDIDNRRAGHLMASHLVELGHRAIGFVEGPDGIFFADERYLGAQQALAEVGASLNPSWCCRDMMTEQFGEDAARKLMANPADRPTAIIVGNRVVASGLMRALKAMGLSVPRDVSVVAHDDELSRYPASGFTPPLTGTVSPFSAAYQLLAEFLSEVVVGSEIMPSLQCITQPTFSLGGSTAKLGAGVLQS